MQCMIRHVLVLLQELAAALARSQREQVGREAGGGGGQVLGRVVGSTAPAAQAAQAAPAAGQMCLLVPCLLADVIFGVGAGAGLSF